MEISLIMDNYISESSESHIDLVQKVLEKILMTISGNLFSDINLQDIGD